MNKKEIFELYEKLYFHEIDVREKLNARLQMPLALIVSLIGALAFMLQNYAFQISLLSSLFLFLLICAFLCLTWAIYYFVRSWFGNEYCFLPSAKATRDYHAQLKTLYKEFAKREQIVAFYFRNYISRYYVDCSSKNTECNDRRSAYVHKTSGAIIFTAVIAFFAFMTFYVGKLDKSYVKKPAEVVIVKPVEIKGPKND
jgi:hypothetical protein